MTLSVKAGGRPRAQKVIIPLGADVDLYFRAEATSCNFLTSDIKIPSM